MDQELVVVNQFMPAMGIEDAKKRRNAVVEFVKSVMVSGTDFGAIPGTGDKPTLLKPGAEKLCTLFGLSNKFSCTDKVEDWTGDEHSGEPLFYYTYKCQLHRGELLISEGEGSCNSHEKKYRYRQGERKCPKCGKSTIIKGKAEYGGGWLCFGKKGGCGAKFDDSDKSIIDQNVGQVLNPDIADQVNTIQKMAQKRALVAATLLAVNASEFFTQDIEDMTIEGDFTVESHKNPAKQEPTKTISPVVIEAYQTGVMDGATGFAVPEKKTWPAEVITWAISENGLGVKSLYQVVGALNQSKLLKPDMPIETIRHWLQVRKVERDNGVEGEEATNRADADLQATMESA